MEIMNSKIEGIENIRTCQGKALDLSGFVDELFDITLVLGPLYHMHIKEDKKRCQRRQFVLQKSKDIFLQHIVCMNEATMIQFTIKAGKECVDAMDDATFDMWIRLQGNKQ